MNLPNYKHRIFTGSLSKVEKFDETNLIDSINSSVDQAEAIILQMQSQFISDAVGALSHEINFNTLESVSKELLDIKVLVEWFFDQKRGGNHE